jgi:hypothetical protein
MYHVDFKHGSREALPRPDAGLDPLRPELVDLQDVGDVLPLRQHVDVALVHVDAQAQLVEDDAALRNLGPML